MRTSSFFSVYFKASNFFRRLLFRKSNCAPTTATPTCHRTSAGAQSIQYRASRANQALSKCRTACFAIESHKHMKAETLGQMLLGVLTFRNSPINASTRAVHFATEAMSRTVAHFTA